MGPERGGLVGPEELAFLTFKPLWSCKSLNLETTSSGPLLAWPLPPTKPLGRLPSMVTCVVDVVVSLLACAETAKPIFRTWTAFN